jgi:hypothetical protein
MLAASYTRLGSCMATYVCYEQANGLLATLSYRAAVFVFYGYNQIGSVMHGYGLFHLKPHDWLVSAVLIVGYINFVAAAYYIQYVVRLRRMHNIVLGSGTHLMEGYDCHKSQKRKYSSTWPDVRYTI